MSTHTIPVLLPMKNQVKNYDWGHPSIIQELTGVPSHGKPQAELWMGVHPGGPSEVDIAGNSAVAGGHVPKWKSLPEAIAQAPEDFLGARVRKAGFESLPFLLKLIAAHKPLSIQCHPSLDAARVGFARENAAAIPQDASHRNYKDPNHKPEIVCALTGMWALSGFRTPADIAADFRLLADKASPEAARFCREQADALEHASSTSPDALSEAFKLLTSAILGVQKPVVVSIVEAAALQTHDRFVRMVEAAAYFPADSGLLFFVVLTLYHLLPGQALFVPAGILHAYVEGLAVEVMANSDNVLRGGLTPKYIDVPELIANLNPAASETYMEAPAVLTEYSYAAHCPEFQLSRFVSPNVPGPTTIPLQQSDGPEVLFCTSGRATVRLEAGAPGGSVLELKQGQSVFIRPWGTKLTIELEGELFRATVPTFP